MNIKNINPQNNNKLFLFESFEVIIIVKNKINTNIIVSFLVQKMKILNIFGHPLAGASPGPGPRVLYIVREILDFPLGAPFGPRLEWVYTCCGHTSPT